MIQPFSHFACPQSPNALLHAPLMHLTPCYISFPLRYSIAPANKILGKTAPIPGAATAAYIVFFRFFCFGASGVLTRKATTHSIGGLVFLIAGGDSASKAFLSREPVRQRPIQLFPSAANHSCGLSLRLASCFLLSCAVHMHSTINMSPLQAKSPIHLAARHALSTCFFAAFLSLRRGRRPYLYLFIPIWQIANEDDSR